MNDRRTKIVESFIFLENNEEEFVDAVSAGENYGRKNRLLYISRNSSYLVFVSVFRIRDREQVSIILIA